MAATYEFTKAANEQLFEFLSSSDSGMLKRAEDAINAYTRFRVREDGIHRRWMPFLQLSNDELDRDIQEKPKKIVDKEPNSPAAVSVPLATLPINVWITAPRYQVLFSRILTPRFTKEIDELRTYYMDLRQVMSDNSIKDMLQEEDRAWFAAVNFSMGGSAGSTSPLSGVTQWQNIGGGVTRDSMQDSFKILPQSTGHLQVHTFIINNVTIHEMMKWGRDEVGGDFSQDVLKNGWSEQSFMNARMIVTIKRDLVPDNSIYLSADPKFIGKAYVLEDATMAIERKFYFLEWFSYELYGSSIGFASGLGRGDF
jgi:hypothetical protein